MHIMQGDAGSIPVKIMLGGAALAPADVAEVEITVGSSAKRYTTGALTYDAAAGAWLYPFAQWESFAMDYAPDIQVRVKLRDGATVLGRRAAAVRVTESVSREVL